MLGELERRVKNPFSAPESDAGVDDAPPLHDPEDSPLWFFPTAPRKLVVLSIASLGVYGTYWFYKNFRAQRSSVGGAMGRTLLLLYSCFSFFERVRNAASEAGISPGFNPTLLGSIFVATSFANRLLPGQFIILPVVAQAITLWPVARSIEALRTELDPRIDPNAKFTLGNYLLIAVGLILWCLVIAASLAKFATPPSS